MARAKSNRCHPIAYGPTDDYCMSVDMIAQEHGQDKDVVAVILLGRTYFNVAFVQRRLTMAVTK